MGRGVGLVEQVEQARGSFDRVAALAQRHIAANRSKPDQKLPVAPFGRVEPERLYAGITLVGKRAHVPAGVTVGRNCRIDPGVIERDFAGADQVASGETIFAAAAAS